MIKLKTNDLELLKSLAIFAVICLSLSVFRVYYSGTIRHLYLPYNLGLALLPLLFALVLNYRFKVLSSAQKAIFFIAWLLFLPNAFYVITDLIHLNPRESALQGFFVGNYSYNAEPRNIGILYDTVLIFGYSMLSYLVGMISISRVHDTLEKSYKYANRLIVGVFIASSFAIYLGRYLRWNSWELVASPINVIRDMGDMLTTSSIAYGALSVTLLFFAITAPVYFGFRTYFKGLGK